MTRAVKAVKNRGIAIGLDAHALVNSTKSISEGRFRTSKEPALRKVNHTYPDIHHLRICAIGLLTLILMLGTKTIYFIAVHGASTGGKTT
jgi:hypothetical protein